MREITWDGLHNARDLGGLGGVRPGRVIRSPRLDRRDTDIVAYLIANGLPTDDLARIRARLLER